MRKLITIATISFLLASGAACSKYGTGAPKMQITNNEPAAEISFAENASPRLIFTYQVGPFDLKSNGSNGSLPRAEAGFNFNVEENVWITSFEPSIEDAEGNPLPPSLVHQIILINHGEENSSCTAKQTGNPFAATTSNLEKIELPEGHGYMLSPADPLEANVVLKNPTDQEYHGIFVKFVLSGEPVDGTKAISDVKPIMVDIDPCNHKAVSIAPGEFVEKTASAIVPESGSLVKAYGLLQDYGVSVSLTTNDEDEPFWQGVAEIDENYQIQGLEPFEDPAGIPVNKGEKINLTVAYDNVSDEWFDEATGAAMIYVARAEEEEKSNGAKEPEEEESEESPETPSDKTSAVSIQKKLLTIY